MSNFDFMRADAATEKQDNAAEVGEFDLLSSMKSGATFEVKKDEPKAAICSLNLPSSVLFKI